VFVIIIIVILLSTKMIKVA